MKALLEKHARAIELRRLGWSYPRIKQELHVSKASLSLWLHKYPLTEKQISELSSLSRERRIEHFRETFRRKREARDLEVYKSEKIQLEHLSNRELYIAGLMLYWGEGQKASTGRVGFSNTNPDMIKFAMYWLEKCCGIERIRMKARFHLYSDMNIEEEHHYWSTILNLPITQFRNPYIKMSLRTQIKEKGGFGHGTCDLIVEDTLLKRKIMMGIKVMSNNVIP